MPKQGVLMRLCLAAFILSVVTALHASAQDMAMPVKAKKVGCQHLAAGIDHGTVSRGNRDHGDQDTQRAVLPGADYQRPDESDLDLASDFDAASGWQ